MARQTFAMFMWDALYGPNGYYARRPALGGAGRDFFTAPELHPAFGALIGRQALEVWQALGAPDVFDLVEHGPGNGTLCRDLLTWADHEATAFAHAVSYRLVESSDPLRAAQRATLQAGGISAARVGWDERPAMAAPGNIEGLILANELLDALPVHLVTVRNGRLLERYVEVEGERRRYVDDEVSTPELAAYFADLGLLPGEGCVAEVNLGALHWARRVAAGLTRGALLVLDYGYPAYELYAPHRRHGTLLCYRGHTVSSDALSHVGQQDMTAHVDFTSVARAGELGGLLTLGLVDQSAFLANLGLRAYRRMLEGARISAVEYDANQRALAELVNPAGLGAVKVLLQAKAMDDFQPAGLGVSRSEPPTWLPLLRPGQMRLAGPLELEGFGDLEGQWREFWSGAEENGEEL